MTAFWGILFLSLGLAGMAFASLIWHLYLFFGIGRMIAMGIVNLGSRLGLALLPLLAQFFILVFGWRLALGPDLRF